MSEIDRKIESAFDDRNLSMLNEHKRALIEKRTWLSTALLFIMILVSGLFTIPTDVYAQRDETPVVGIRSHYIEFDVQEDRVTIEFPQSLGVGKQVALILGGQLGLLVEAFPNDTARARVWLHHIREEIEITDVELRGMSPVAAQRFFIDTSMYPRDDLSSPRGFLNLQTQELDFSYQIEIPRRLFSGVSDGPRIEVTVEVSGRLDLSSGEGAIFGKATIPSGEFAGTQISFSPKPVKAKKQSQVITIWLPEAEACGMYAGGYDSHNTIEGDGLSPKLNYNAKIEHANITDMFIPSNTISPDKSKAWNRRDTFGYWLMDFDNPDIACDEWPDTAAIIVEVGPVIEWSIVLAQDGVSMPLCTNYTKSSQFSILKGAIKKIRNKSIHTLHIWRGIGDTSTIINEPRYSTEITANQEQEVEWETKDVLNEWGANISDAIKSCSEASTVVPVTIWYTKP